MVVLYHCMAFSHLISLPLIRHANLFVDFFFVLSGFVIMASYGQRLRAGFGVNRFLFLRFGRVYPLHVALMLPFVMILAVKSGVGSTLCKATATNLLLLHGLGLPWIGSKTLGALNFPSWSISAEFAAYIVFAMTIRLPNTLFRGVTLATIVLCPLIILMFSPDLMNSTFDYGIFRCLYGFALGIACFELHARWDWTASVPTKAGRSLVELSIAGLTVFLVIRLNEADPLTLAMPIVFAVVVIVFARDSGRMSQVMLRPAWQWIGARSYSIYMVHALVQVLMRASGFALQHFTHRPLFTPLVFGTETEDLLGVTLWQGDVAVMIMLAGTLALAALTYGFIEEPARLWSRRMASPSWNAWLRPRQRADARLGVDVQGS